MRSVRIGLLLRYVCRSDPSPALLRLRKPDEACPHNSKAWRASRAGRFLLCSLQPCRDERAGTRRLARFFISQRTYGVFLRWHEPEEFWPEIRPADFDPDQCVFGKHSECLRSSRVPTEIRAIWRLRACPSKYKPRWSCPVERFFSQQSIERYRELLEISTDEPKRRLIFKLLAAQAVRCEWTPTVA